MSSDRLAQYDAFVRVAERGSFSAAARDLGVSQPSVSKLVANLEARLGIRLLARSTRALALTEEGARFLDKARLALEAAEAAEAASAAGVTPSGLLRLAAPVSFGAMQIAPRLCAFHRLYPDVQVDLRLSDRFVDIVAEGMDLAIRVGELKDSALSATWLATARRVCVAAPAYLERRPAPMRPEALAQHDCIVYSGLQDPSWRFRSPDGEIVVVPSGRFRSDSSVAIRAMATDGLGVAFNPLWLFADDLRAGRLVELLADFAPEPMPIQAVTPARRFTPARVGAMTEFLKSAFRADPSLSG